MDINDLRGISTVFVMAAFLAVTIWAYSSKRRKGFDEAANLPFADEDTAPNPEPEREHEKGDTTHD